jgi:hypothetical protein
LLADAEVSGNVSFAGGTVVISGAYAAANTFISSGNARFSVAADTGTLELSGGTLEGDGDLTVGGLLRWSGGAMQGTGTTIANGGIELSGSTKQLLDGRTLENNGNALWSGGVIIANNGAIFHNRSTATLNMQHDATFSVSGGTSATFSNEGTLIKSGGSGMAFLFPTFNNSGSVTAESGSIAFRGGFSQGASGVLNVQIGGLTPLTEFDQYQVIGQANLDGTLNVTLVNGFTPNAGDIFQIMTFSARSGEFATVNGNGQEYTVTYGNTDVTLTAE